MQSHSWEVIGGMSAFFVFLFGAPARSEMVSRAALRLVREAALIVLCVVTFFAQSLQQSAHYGARMESRLALPKAPGHRARAAVARRVQPVIPAVASRENWMMQTHPTLYHITYVFEGKATSHGVPAPRANILVRVIVGDQLEMHRTVTGADGLYSIPVPVNASEKDSVGWTIEASSSNLNKVEVEGIRIVLSGEEQEKAPVVVNTPVEFLVSLSK